MCAVYWNWSLENAGGVMMFAGMLLCFLPGGYYYFWSRRMKARPEDDPQATPAQGAGVVGAFFSVLALVFGIWFLVPGLGLVFWAVLGGTSEGRRGGRV